MDVVLSSSAMLPRTSLAKISAITSTMVKCCYREGTEILRMDSSCIGKSVILSTKQFLSSNYKHNDGRWKMLKSRRQHSGIDNHAYTSKSYSTAVQNESSQPMATGKTPFCSREFVYQFHTATGGKVKVFVRRVDTMYRVTIEVTGITKRDDDLQQNLNLQWGIYRTDSSRLVTLKAESVPEGTTYLTLNNKNFMKTQFHKASGITYTLDLNFDARQSPLFVSFFLSTSKDTLIRNHLGENFCVPVGFSRGKPYPLGFFSDKDGSANFAVYSKAADAVVLCLYDSTSAEPCLQIELSPYMHRTGNVWHISFDNLGSYTRYGYQCKGDINWENGNRFHDCRVLLDPYARILAPFLSGQDSSKLPASCLGWLVEEPAFDWGNVTPPSLPMEELVLYRLNIESFTSDQSSGVQAERRGTFLGLIDKIQHFKTLGVNAILLEPIFAFDKNQGSYFPYNFFAPHDGYGYSKDSISASLSFKEMVRACHENGIEVFLEVIYTHTAERGDVDPEMISFRGIDHATYYVLDENKEVSGVETINQLNCNQPVVQSLVIDSLRHWLMEYHIDGFCFSNSSALLKGAHGEFLSRPPLLEAIAFDPFLSKAKIIADPCLPTVGACNDVAFPHWKKWAELNIKYKDDVRRFVRGDRSQLSSFATRICGSGDEFTDGRGPSFSLNFITYSCGLSLVDLVSFSDSVSSTELSWNCGEEGPTNRQSILETRLKQIRNYLFILFVSLGVPILNMGDECGHSKGGLVSLKDRQPYIWDYLKSEFALQTTQFIGFLSSLRSSRKSLFQRKSFAKIENVNWHGELPGQPQWDDPNSLFLAVSLNSERNGAEPSSAAGDIYIAFNSHPMPKFASLPELPLGISWCRLVDTSLPFPETISIGRDTKESGARFSTYEVQSHSCVLFEAHE